MPSEFANQNDRGVKLASRWVFEVSLIASASSVCASDYEVQAGLAAFKGFEQFREIGRWDIAASGRAEGPTEPLPVA